MPIWGLGIPRKPVCADRNSMGYAPQVMVPQQQQQWISGMNGMNADAVSMELAAAQAAQAQAK